MDTIQEAFEELSILKAIRPIDADHLFVNTNRLFDIGYVLILYAGKPTFCKISDVQRYIYNPIFYLENVIPREALNSYTTIKLKTDYSSF